MFGTLTMEEEAVKPDWSTLELSQKRVTEPEIKRLQAHMKNGLWDLLAENNCIIAGGSLTSVFTNKPVNDLDIYFRSLEDYQNVMLEVYGVTDNYDLSYGEKMVNHYTARSVLLRSEDQDVQFIAYKFFPFYQNIFRSFDFTINMCALDMKNETLNMHPLFIKHNAQRYLSFNPNTDYPLISAMRVDKYRERGYTISKSQMFRILLAVNKKNIDSWEKLIDEVGGMYGTAPEEIFDTKRPFSLELAIEDLTKIEYTDKYVKESGTDFTGLWRTQPKNFDAEFIKRAKEIDNAKPSYYRTLGSFYNDDEPAF